MDGILGVSSPSRRVSFTTSSERDRPFVRPHPPSPTKRRVHARAQKALLATTGVIPKLEIANSLHPSASTTAKVSPTAPEVVCALLQEAPQRPIAPVRTRIQLRSAFASGHATVAEESDDLPPSSPIASPLSSPLTSPVEHNQISHARENEGSLPPSSPIAIPRSPARYVTAAGDYDLTPSPPSPTLDALRITSRVSVRALLNPTPEPCPPQSSSASSKGNEEPTPVDIPVADEDVVPLDLSDPSAEINVAACPVQTQAAAQDQTPLSGCSHPRAPSLPVSNSSRAGTPDVADPDDTLSSPLSSPPRSVADEEESAIDIDVGVHVDIDIETEDCRPLTALPVEPPRSTIASRAPSIVRDFAEEGVDRVRLPPRKKARRADDADLTPLHAALLEKNPIAPVAIDQRGNMDLQVSDGDRPEAARKQQGTSQKKRRRVIWSDDELDSDADVPTSVPDSSEPQPVSAQKLKSQEVPRKRVREKGQDKERDREKTKKPRVKAAGDAENEPLKSLVGSGVGLVGPPSTAKAASAGPAPPASATNLTLPAPVSSSPPRPVGEEHPPVQSAEDVKARHDQFATNAKDSYGATPKIVGDLSKTSCADDKENRDLLGFTLPLPAAELEGMLIETLATSRASSLATTALYGALMAARPALREMALPFLTNAPVMTPADEEEKPKEEKQEGGRKPRGGRGRGGKADAAEAASRRAWVPALEGVLEAGWRRSGVFGKVVNSGTDMGDQELTLEARWFYDPDRDEDQERATLVRSMMRRPPKRSETKKAKQYYWRPLPKISRWDPEDEL
ncbi:hypothetical protein BN946_scf184894.g13 [Trametes cinnabarina]|uniref:Uncharacterized protein n=1 Tax=Pycnoporus cinnabarinus TaxID=5643 RepID=A0A060SVJ7_PYCCI|nr:hypothetical protein BN946_scf184894.g13 [Trametes cinnabarina]